MKGLTYFSLLENILALWCVVCLWSWIRFFCTHAVCSICKLFFLAIPSVYWFRDFFKLVLIEDVGFFISPNIDLFQRWAYVIAADRCRPVFYLFIVPHCWTDRCAADYHMWFDIQKEPVPLVWALRCCWFDCAVYNSRSTLDDICYASHQAADPPWWSTCL